MPDTLSKMFSDKVFFKKTWMIVLPITIQTMLNMLTNMVDTIMIGRLGEAQIGGVGLANKVFFVYSLIVYGVSSGTGVLASQYWGVKDEKSIRSVTGLGLIIAFVFSMIISFCCVAFPETVMSIFTNIPSLIEEGGKYLRIVAVSYLFIGVSTVLDNSLRSMDIVKPAMYISIGAIITNVFFNYVLIFGKLGFPELGVEGAAIATVIARVVELVLTIIALKIVKSALWCNPKYYFDFDSALVQQFASRSGPVVVNEFMWGLGTAMCSPVYGRMGESTAAVMTIVGTYMDIEMVGAKGLSAATAIILGNEMGAGELDNAKRHSRYFIILSAIVGAFFTLLTVVVAKPFASIYEITPESYDNVVKCLYIFAGILMIKIIDCVTIIGVLRSGGDTIAAAMIDLLTLWLVAVPLVYLSGLTWMLPVTAVFVCANLDELIKCPASLIRIKKGFWLKNLSEELQHSRELE